MENAKLAPAFKVDDDPFVVSRGSMAWNHTGSWKYLEPFFDDWTPPCSNACPAGNDIVTHFRLIEDGRHAEAATAILEHNPFPATLGCICSHPCETPCNRKALGGEIVIRSVERFLGEYAIEHDVMPSIDAPTGRRVTVIGGGPAGLSAAYFARKLGHEVTVLVGEKEPGGMLSRIPAFRLPQDILTAELERLRRMGIVFKCGVTLPEQVPPESILPESDAWLIGTAPAAPSTSMPTEGKDRPSVFDASRLLDSFRDGQAPRLGRDVVVLGSGDIALDCARSLIRLGHAVTIVCSANKMEASKENVVAATEEGVRIELSTVINRFLPSGIECIRAKRGPVNQDKREEYALVPGTEFLLGAGSVVECSCPHLDRPNSQVAPGEHSQVPCVFVWTEESLENGAGLARAVAAGRRAAYAVHSFWGGSHQEAPNALAMRGAKEEIAKYKEFNTAYFSVEKGPGRRLRNLEERRLDFIDAAITLTETEARQESVRCFKCGTCTLCGNCELFCPDNSIVLEKDGSRYRVQYDYCKGCMACVEECPRAALHSRRAEQ